MLNTYILTDQRRDNGNSPPVLQPTFYVQYCTTTLEKREFYLYIKCMYYKAWYAKR